MTSIYLLACQSPCPSVNACTYSSVNLFYMENTKALQTLPSIIPTALHCTALHSHLSTALHCTALHCTLHPIHCSHCAAFHCNAGSRDGPFYDRVTRWKEAKEQEALRKKVQVRVFSDAFFSCHALSYAV